MGMPMRLRQIGEGDIITGCQDVARKLNGGDSEGGGTALIGLDSGFAPRCGKFAEDAELQRGRFK
jgi:hypothetical protein